MVSKLSITIEHRKTLTPLSLQTSKKLLYISAPSNSKSTQLHFNLRLSIDATVDITITTLDRQSKVRKGKGKKKKISIVIIASYGDIAPNFPCTHPPLLDINSPANVSKTTVISPGNLLRRFAVSPIVAAYNQPYLAPPFDFEFQYHLQSNPSSLYSGSASTASDLTFIGDQQFSSPNYHISDNSPRPSKRLKPDGKPRQIKVRATINNQMPANDIPTAITAAASDGFVKAKRVRTGCLTCRERHLKCDEGVPDCQNCRKSSRTCKRGVRLNFIDTQIKSPPMIPPTADWAGR